MPTLRRQLCTRQIISFSFEELNKGEKSRIQLTILRPVIAEAAAYYLVFSLLLLGMCLASEC